MSPKSPRNVSGQDLIKLLERFGYQITRQKGSHIRLSHISNKSTHHLTIPNHDPLKLGTFSAIITDAVQHLNITKEDLLRHL